MMMMIIIMINNDNNSNKNNNNSETTIDIILTLTLVIDLSRKQDRNQGTSLYPVYIVDIYTLRKLRFCKKTKEFLLTTEIHAVSWAYRPQINFSPYFIISLQEQWRRTTVPGHNLFVFITKHESASEHNAPTTMGTPPAFVSISGVLPFRHLEPAACISSLAI
jgi:hypothetical protein